MNGNSTTPPQPLHPLPEEEADWLQYRDRLGRHVRKVWVAYCRKIGDTKPSHIASWEEMSEEEREADRVIGEALWKAGYVAGADAAWSIIGTPDTDTEEAEKPYSSPL